MEAHRWGGWGPHTGTVLFEALWEGPAKENNDAHWPLRGVQDALELHVGEQNWKSKELSGGASQVLRNVSSREQATEVGGPLAD